VRSKFKQSASDKGLPLCDFIPGFYTQFFLDLPFAPQFEYNGNKPFLLLPERQYLSNNI
jgi:hypothetical protein